jgi:hypothetical protein
MVVRSPEAKRISVEQNSCAEPILAGVLVIGQAGDAPFLHCGEESRAVSLTIEHYGEAVQKGIRLKLGGSGLIRDVLFKTRNDVVRQSLQNTWVDSLADYEERLALHRIDPIVSGRAQAQALARDIVFGQFLGSAVVNPHMAIDVENGRLFRRLRHPLFAKLCTPFERPLLIGQMLELDAQGANFRDAIQTNQFSPFTRRVIAQSLNGPEPAERHERQQQKNGLKTVKSGRETKHLLGVMQKPADQE